MNDETKKENSNSKEQLSDLEKELQFSWSRVIKRGFQNMKDDMDPVYKGAKMGFYALHGIPTWIREHRDGKLNCDSPGWAGLTAVLVGGTSVAGYVVAATASSLVLGPLGPSLLAVPVVSQGAAYCREAFRRARKTEHANILMTYVQHSLNNADSKGYELSNKELIQGLANKLFEQKEKEVNAEIKQNEYRISSRKEELETLKKAEDMKTIDKHREVKHAEENIKHYNKEINTLNKNLTAYKEKSLVEAREGITYFAREVFDGLFADNKVGKKYEMGGNLEVGPKKRRRDHERELRFEESPLLDESSVLGNILYDAVSKNDGHANVQILGEVTAVYDGKSNKASHYEVVPNEVWKLK